MLGLSSLITNFFFFFLSYHQSSTGSPTADISRIFFPYSLPNKFKDSTFNLYLSLISICFFIIACQCQKPADLKQFTPGFLLSEGHVNAAKLAAHMSMTSCARTKPWPRCCGCAAKGSYQQMFRRNHSKIHAFKKQKYKTDRIKRQRFCHNKRLTAVTAVFLMSGGQPEAAHVCVLSLPQLAG